MALFRESVSGGECSGCGRKFSVWNIPGMYAAKLAQSRGGQKYVNIVQAYGRRHAATCKTPKREHKED